MDGLPLAFAFCVTVFGRELPSPTADGVLIDRLSGPCPLAVFGPLPIAISELSCAPEPPIVWSDAI